MHLYLHILLYYLSLVEISTKSVEIQCPEHCKCDIFEKLRRATCIKRNLAGIESNLPQQTQLLDLSYNQISRLGDHIFSEQKLVELKLLNISHNKVGQIHMNAFVGLGRLKSLDLSYNSIQYILNHWFLNMNSLEELYFRGNSFSKLTEGPIFESRTLKRLDLSLCRISYVGVETMTGLPNLEILNLSENYLIQLNVATVQPLSSLSILNINNNSFHCNDALRNLTDYCSQKGISFEDPCRKKILESEKFQRMVNMADPEDEKNSWIYDDQEGRNDTTKPAIDQCNITHVDKSLLQEIVDLSPFLSLLIPFIYGIAVGVLIAYIIGSFTKKKKDLNESTYFSFDETNHLHRSRSRFNRVSGRFSRAYSAEERQALPLREWNLSESTPVLFRKNQSNL
ncbi:hypothetical protein MTP99_018926 [Tenebrio molitor]|nr:hypothetical protein MTP99_018926 [Tenebrio molitor]